MSSEEKKEKLFGEFPPITTSQWEEKILEDLKGADYNKKLIWQTIDGIDVRPYYREEDLKKLHYLDVLPGEYPFIRGYKTRNNDWDICQEIVVQSFREANRKALSLIDKGVSSPKFILSEKLPENLKRLEELLENIDLQSVPVHFSVPSIEPSLLNLLFELVIKKGYDSSGIKGSLDFDPLGYWFRTGNYFKNKKTDLLSLKKSLDFGIKNLPSFRVISVSAGIFHQAGASISQELGFALATGAEYLSTFTDHGLNAGDIAQRISFNFSTGSDYFPEIAKLRSARVLWSVITSAFSPEYKDSCRMNINCSTSGFNQTVFDPYNNLLRATTEAMSSILGGADSLTVLPFDNATGNSGEFSERLARNIQLILREEAYFNKVADPSAGSYYIENLTKKISENAWKIFINIEKERGILNAAGKEIIQDMIETTAKEKVDRIALRKDKMVGINRYPDIEERISGKMKSTGDEEYHEKKPFGRPIRKTRAASEFEQLRIKTNMSRKTPCVFLLTFGDPARRRARAAFSSEFFACAGFKIMDNIGFKSLEEGIATSLKKSADIVVLCSSDEEYAEAGPVAAKKLKGKAVVVIAGYPEKIIEQLKAGGLEHFIHMKSNVLEELKKYQKILGIL
jgi:methylmalonyl-CoA mutase